MEPLKSVLAGLDFTPTSPLIIEKAARIARGAGAQLTLVHAVDEDRFERFRATRKERVEPEQILMAARARMAETLTKHDLSGLSVSTEVLLGSPFGVISDLVEARSIDLVVLSAHDARDRRLGPVASRCVRRVPADVLLLRDWHTRPYERIAACVDFSETSRHALAQAIRLALQDHARLELIHVIYPPGRDYAGQTLYQHMDDRLSFEQEILQEVEASIQDFTRPFAAELAGLNFRSTVLQSTHASLEITSYVKQQECDLVALGTTGKGGMFGNLLGSNAERLIHDVGCSVLAVKAARGSAT